MNLNETIKALFPNQRVVAFYIRLCNIVPDEWMVALGEELRNLGFATIGLLADNAVTRMNLDGLGHVFSITQKDLQHLDSIACFIVTDIEVGPFPATSRVLAVMHSMSVTTDPKNCASGVYATGYYDGLVVGFPFAHRRQEIKELWNNFPPPERNIRPSATFYLMGYGYPKLELMRRNFRARAKNAPTPRSICYAPVEMFLAPEFGGNRVRLYGKHILHTLLCSFPDYEVIFRPAPKDIYDPLVLELAACFADNPRFHFDTNSSYLDTFTASRVMVTDFSHIGSSFKLTTLRPSVYFRPWSDKAFPFANPYPALISALEYALALPPYKADMLDKEQGFLPVENAARNLAQAIPDFIDARPHEDWLIIKRDKDSPGASLLKRIRIVLASGHAAVHAQQHASYGNSRALAVLSLHLHKLLTPQATIPSWIGTLAGLDNGQSGGDRCYGDIRTEELLALYAAAEREESAQSCQPEEVKQQDLAALRKLADLARRKANLIAMNIIFSKREFFQ